MSAMFADGGADGTDGAACSCSFEQCLVFPNAAAVDAGSEAETVTTVEFDATGDLVAMGDKGGRVVVYAREPGGGGGYGPLCEFKSHDPEFDYLKSLEVEEKINQIRFCRGAGPGRCRLLAANDKTVKLWRVGERRVASGGGDDGDGGAPNARFAASSGGSLRIPRVVRRATATRATAVRSFANAHAYHVNSVSCCSDGEHFASADDLRINLWNLEVDDRAFNVVDLKPANMEDLTEVITSAAFHPRDCNVLLYASSKGTIKLFDLRQTARCDNHATLLEDAPEDAATKSFFSEIVSSISDARFSGDGGYVVSRDFLSVKVWDARSSRRPLKTILVHEHLRPRLCDLYESDCIFDKFEVCASADAAAVFTGSYSDAAHVFDAGAAALEIDLEKTARGAGCRDGSTSPDRPQAASGALEPTSGPSPPTTWRRHLAAAASAGDDVPLEHAGGGVRVPLGLIDRDDAAGRDAVDFRRRVLHVAAHPTEETFAVAGLDRAYLFKLHRAPAY